MSGRSLYFSLASSVAFTPFRTPTTSARLDINSLCAYRHISLPTQHYRTLSSSRNNSRKCRSPLRQPTIVHTARKFQTSTATSTTPANPGEPIQLDQKPAKAPPVEETPARPSRLRQRLTTSALFVVFLAVGFTMSAAPAVDSVNGFVNPPTNEETLTLFQAEVPEQADINERIVTHPLAVKLRAQQGLVESRPHMKMPPTMRIHNLTGGTLLGHGKIEVPPLTFSDNEAELPWINSLSYVGPQLCGHPGIIHGGLLATMLDEGLAKACFPALPNKVGVTASLKIDYRKPCPANSYLVLKAYTTKVEGRKAWVKGWIEILGDTDEDGVKVAEAEALFIEPKGAANMARVYSTT